MLRSIIPRTAYREFLQASSRQFDEPAEIFMFNLWAGILRKRRWARSVKSVTDDVPPPESESSKKAIFDFTPEMSVGNESIDADHRAFFQISKLLSETLESGERGMVVLSTLSMLEEYVDGHFLREEKAMQKVNFTNFSVHRLKHNLFRARVKAIADVFRQGSISAADDLPPLIAQWLRSHIANEDQKYKRWLTNASVDNRPLVFLAIEAEQRQNSNYHLLNRG